MRPYLAIIKDSFRAALASRVLYVLLGLITLLLIGIAPFHYREVLDWQIKRDQHVRDPAFLVETLLDRKEDEDRLGVQRIWSQLSDDLKKELVAIGEKEKAKENGESEAEEEDDVADEDLTPRERRRRRRERDGNPLEDFPTYRKLITELNDMIQDRDFYREDDWKDALVSNEAVELMEAGPNTLTDDRSRRLNRLLIGDAMGSAVENGAATALDFYYLTWKWDFLSTNTTHQQFANDVASNIPWFFDKFVMSIGLLIAILVTANIIPETFDAGSLNLLLSKPVTRWGLLIAKFAGGCAFVALCAAYLFAGVWLWLGLGLGIWDRSLLFAIPIYVLVFAIYYSVSTFVGIYYRSAILSVILTAIFWAICFGVGFTYGLLNNRMQNIEISNLVPVEDGALQVDPLKKIYCWNNKNSSWDSKLKAQMAQEQEIGIGIALFLGPLGPIPDGLGPIYDPETETVISGIINLTDPRTMSQQEVYLADVTYDLVESGSDTIMTPSSSGLEFEPKGRFPRNSVALFNSEKGPLVVDGSGNLYTLKPEFTLAKFKEEAAAEEPVEEADNKDEEEEDKPETRRGTVRKPEIFEEIAKTRISVKNGSYVDFNDSNQEIAIYRRGELSVFEPDEQGGYRRRGKIQIDTETSSQSMSCKVAYQGKMVTLVLGNGQVITIDGSTLKEVNGYLPETRSAVEQLAASKDGRWVAIVYRNETLWIIDHEKPEGARKAPFGGQGTISCVNFDEKNRIWIADRTDRATLYDLKDYSEVVSLAPGSDWFASTYRYILGPIYKVFPKPGELYKVVTYLSSTGDTKYNRDVDLTLTTENKNPFDPLWSGLGFMALVLFMACCIFHFRDF